MSAPPLSCFADESYTQWLQMAKISDLERKPEIMGQICCLLYEAMYTVYL